MNFLDFLQGCAEKGIQFSLDGDQLKINAPKNTLTPDVVQEMRLFKPALMDWLKENSDTNTYATDDFNKIEVVDRTGHLPISFGQEQLWLTHTLSDVGDSYHFIRTLDLRGPLDVIALGASFTAILERHEVLRTVFMEQDGVVFQRVLPVAPIDLSIIDLEDFNKEEKQEKVYQLQQELRSKAFDLSCDLMMRLQLVHLEKGHHKLIVVLHHIASDGWSLGVLVSNLQSFYEHYSKGTPLLLPVLPVQYVDYSSWQRLAIQNNKFSNAINFWQNYLQTAPLIHNLPTDFQRPTNRSFNSSTHHQVFDQSIVKALRHMAQRSGTTLFMVLESLFALLLSRYSHSDDIVIGTPVANRENEDIAGLIGCFVNMVALRHEIDHDLSFVQLLERAKTDILAAFDNQQLPFEKVVQSVVKTRSSSYSPLVQIVFVLQNNEIPDLVLSDVICQVQEPESANGHFELRLKVTETTSGLDLDWRFATDLFTVETIARMAGHFECFCKNIINNPDMPVGRLDLLSLEEHQRLLESWNDTATAYPASECIHELFEARAAEQPDAVALVFEGRQLTYGELNQRSNQLAHYLVNEKQVKADTLVGICVERSFEMVVGILAILKAGGAYVPLDPDYPEARLAYMLEDAVLATVLTQQHLRETTPVSDAQALCLDSPAVQEQLLLQPDTNPDGSAQGLGPHNLAYVIYTSGSTGNPKGVMVEHYNITRLLASAEGCFSFNTNDVWTMFHSYAFDFSVWEIWGALAYGGRLVLVPYWVSRSPTDFYQLLVAEHVTVLNQTPSAFSTLMHEDAMQNTALALRYVIFGGEALNLASLAPWFDRHGDNDPALINMYGITETTVHVTYRQITQALVSTATGASLIGKPLADLQVVILNGHHSLVPPGVAGEMYVGGAGVTRGYLHQPALTESRFVSLPGFGNQRFYRTGDLARYLPNQELEYLGRIDHQVKIRGFRIELGEIESALTNCASVEDAVVLARESMAGDKQLVAYVITHAVNLQDAQFVEQRRVFIDNLRQQLNQTLPDYMVPSAFLLLDQLPLTPNGKVDRKALPALDIASQQAAYIAPHNSVEKLLCNVWQEVLGVERVGVTDNFFQLGGQSILAMRMINQVQKILEEIIQMVAIFTSPTVREFASYLEQRYAPALIAKGLLDTAGLANVTATISLLEGNNASELMQKLIAHTPAYTKPIIRKNPKMVFLLSAPRSGSTLLRVMLAGNPALFAPPELELLSFETMIERDATFSSQFSFYKEGAVRAVMEARHCDADQALKMIAEMSGEGMSTLEFYGSLQSWVSPRLLVDKTPSYAYHPVSLQHAEDCFEDALFIHLIRHPYGMISSFEKAQMDQVLYLNKNEYSPRQLGELTWASCNENILTFLKEVPAGRQHAIHFESLVDDPAIEMEKLCEFLGVEYHPGMLTPYEATANRMVDGVQQDSRMIGDVKFHTHKQIDSSTKDSWKNVIQQDFLSSTSWMLAEDLGYQRHFRTQYAIPKCDYDQTALPSFAQQRLWLLDQIDGGSAHYNMPGALRLSGQLDIAALSRAFDTILERHESLRTCFAVDPEGQPIQVIRPVSGFTLAQQDLSVLDEGERQLQLSRAMVEETRRPFDLGADLMLRAQLLVLGKGEHILLVTMHHIASDGWSMSILINEFSALYRAYSQGEANPLAALPIQYADYAHWQRDWLQGEVLEQQLGYWAQQLAGLPVVHSLPLDHPRPPVQSFAGETYRSVISRDTQEALVRFCQSRGATLFMGLHAAFSVLLSRYSNETDIVMGSPIANREQSEVAGLIGFFVNTLVLRSDLSGEPGFGGLLEQSKHMLLDAYAHQQVPFEQIVERLQPERSLSHSALFQVMLALQNNDKAVLVLSDLVVTPVHQEGTIAQYDLSISINETAQGLLLGWEYNTALFEPTTIARMASHFDCLLESLLASPEENVFRANMLDAAERQQLLETWNDTTVAYPADKCIHQLFEEQVFLHPQKTALFDDHLRLDYAELNAYANGLASYLATVGVRQGDVVPVVMEARIEVPVTLLAIMKLGAIFAPLDLRWPTERLRTTLQKLNPRIVLGDRTISAELVNAVPFYCVSLEKINAISANIQCSVTPDSPIYIMYTSGSTGVPKGAINLHKGIVNRFAFMDSFFNANHEVVMQTTHHCFDSSVWQFFWPLLSGGSCYLPDREKILDVNYVVKSIENHRITVTDFTPALFAELVEELQTNAYRKEALSSVKALVIGGEAININAVKKFKSSYPAIDLINAYGPTETSIGVVFYRIPNSCPDSIPIGKPINNVKVFVLDQAGALVPTGIFGELHIAGVCVGGGYWGEAELSAEKFIPNPFWDAHNPASSERLYKTGDLVRWLPDGDLEYLGRIDHQVKIRGFRIELGEIENVLRSHSVVKDAVVLVRESNGDKRLVAYLVPDVAPEEVKPDLSSTWMESLRHHLGDTLPDYMVPSAFVILEQLPLTPNGKVDRKALPEPDLSAQQAAYVAPRTVTERVLCEIWQTLLGVERVGISDNFFQLGGHSLLATRLMARINQAFQVNLPLKTLFNSHTLERLANEIAGLDIDLQRPALAKVARDQSIPPSFAQQRLWLLDQIDGSSAHYNMPGALRLSGQLDIAALSRAFDTILERHESLRTCFAVDPEGQPIQVIRPVSGFTLAQQDLSVLDEGERQLQLSRAMVEETRRPFDLGADLMLRAQLLVLGKGEHILLVTMHHIASDGWSMSILINEFSALYRAYSQGEANPLAALPIQYADYAHWQRDWLQGEVLEQQLGYWAQQLAGLPVVHSLPLDHPRPPVQSFAGETYRSVISRDTQEALVRFCQSRGATLFMGLHAAFSVLLSRYSNETDIVMGSPIANREQSEVAGLIGFFVNTLVLRSDLSGEPGFGGLLEQSKHMLLDAYAHQQVPFEQIVERLQPERSLSHSALFQVMLVLQNNEEAQLALPGLVLEQVTQSSTIAKFDLTINVSESEQGLLLDWIYSTALFEPTTIARMAGHFGRLLESLLASPEENVFNVEILGDVERQNLLQIAIAGDSANSVTETRLLHSRLLNQININGNKAAIKTNAKVITYAELGMLSEQLSQQLINGGSARNKLIAVVMEKGWEQIVAVLAILRAGAAYLPIDANLPAERIALLLELGEISQVVTTPYFAKKLFFNSQLSVVQIDQHYQYINDSTLKMDEYSNIPTVDDLAYVIFTSGSTGTPKGVMIDHKGAANTVDDICTRFNLNSNDNVLALSNLNFDLSVFDIFGLLAVGGTVVVPQENEIQDPNAWVSYLQEENITIWNTVPAFMQILTQQLVESINPFSLRLVLMSGDWIPTDLPEKIAHQFPYAQQISLGGATEASIWSISYPILDVSTQRKTIPYGKALTNQHMFVLQKDLSPCPYGVVGEICIGGIGLSLGYWRDERKTESSFVINPQTGSRLYKTGDLGRLLPDGNIEFIGRIDHQVKIRGFRIELGEIENSLASKTDVKETIVLAKESMPGAGDTYLAAYVITENINLQDESDAAVSARHDYLASLRQHLGQRLPDYMIPAVFILLEQWPLTANGKLDRKALPEPDFSSVQTVYVAPRTDTEKLLCEIWQDMLGVERVGVTDSFFMLGGHSLSLMQLVSKIYSVFQIKIPARVLYQHSTISELGLIISQGEVDVEQKNITRRYETVTGEMELQEIEL